jgi:chloride channel 7
MVKAQATARMEAKKHFDENCTHELMSFESMSSMAEESKIHFEMRALRTNAHMKKLIFASHGLVFAIGLIVSCTAAGIAIASHALHKQIINLEQYAMHNAGAGVAGLCFVGSQVLCISLAASLVMWQPNASGSGLQQIKATLNGSDLPGFLSWRTAFAKATGILFVVATGLPLDQEGPMVTIGAILASLISCLEIGPFAELIELRVPLAQRQWVGMGAAAGVAAAFHAPLGGILYSFEYGPAPRARTSSPRSVTARATHRHLTHHRRSVQALPTPHARPPFDARQGGVFALVEPADVALFCLRRHRL